MIEGAFLRFYRLWGFLGVLGALMAAGPGVSQGSSPAPAAPGSAASRVEVLANYGRLTLHFIPNQGQADPQVRFYARRGGTSFFFTRKGLVLVLPQAAAGRETSGSGPEAADRHKVVRLNPVSLAPGVKLAAVERMPGKVNYFRGSDPKNWRTDITTYRAVVYQEAYPGIDLKFYGNGHQLEYDIIVRPGADPAQVKFCCQGVIGLDLTPAGDLALKLPGGGRTGTEEAADLPGDRRPAAGAGRLLPGAEGTGGLQVRLHPGGLRPRPAANH
jgi:hypothetical protein